VTTIRAAAHKKQGHPLLPSCRSLQKIKKTAIGLKFSQNIQAGSVKYKHHSTLDALVLKNTE
jgi:hypothetical protein